jgi:hypothetical protein
LGEGREREPQSQRKNGNKFFHRKFSRLAGLCRQISHKSAASLYYSAPGCTGLPREAGCGDANPGRGVN